MWVYTETSELINLDRFDEVTINGKHNKQTEDRRESHTFWVEVRRINANYRNADQFESEDCERIGLCGEDEDMAYDLVEAIRDALVDGETVFDFWEWKHSYTPTEKEQAA